MNNSSIPDSQEIISAGSAPPKKPVWLIFLLIFLLAIVIGGGISYLRQKRLKQQSKSIGGSADFPGQVKDESYDKLIADRVTYNDFFSWSGWQSVSGDGVAGDGSSFKMPADPNSNWVRYENQDVRGTIIVNGDFDITFKYKFGCPKSLISEAAKMRFQSIKNDDTKEFIFLTIFRDGTFELFTSGSDGKTLANGNIPENASVKIKFTGVGLNQPESISVYNEGVGKELARAVLPHRFFPSGNRFGLTVEVSGKAEYFQLYDFVIGADKSSNIQRVYK